MDNQYRRQAGRGCAVCRHPEREAIEQWLASGQSVRSVATMVDDLSRKVIRRHLHHHLTLEELRTNEEAG